MPDLDAIRSRYQLARLAGQSADDAGEGWTPAKIRALVRSWQDVADLHDYVKAMSELPAPPKHRATH